MRKPAAAGMPPSVRRPPGAHRATMVAAGLIALLLAAACSSESATDPDPSAAAGLSPETAPSPAPQPAPAARPAPASQPYASLWRAAAAGASGAWGGQNAAARRPAAAPAASAPAGPAMERLLEPEPTTAEWPDGDSAPPEAASPGADSSAAGNTPDNFAAPTEDPSDEPAPDRPAGGGRLRMEDYALLSRYLEGIASWYGPNFHGKPTANGETYNQYGLTAAHPVLPIGTRVLVENLSNGRRVWLRINDRGPYVKGRVLDLSRIAAERLGIVARGTAPVRITVLKWPQTVEPVLGLKAFQQYTVQAAAYPEPGSAEELRERLQAQHPRLPFFVDRASNGFYSVAAGPFDDEREARQAARSIHRSGMNPIVKRYRK